MIYEYILINVLTAPSFTFDYYMCILSQTIDNVISYFFQIHAVFARLIYISQ